MPTANWGKTHCTAVAIIPPENVWEPIQALRRKYDRQFERWMPHINLLYPFVAEEHFDEARQLLAAALSMVPAFRIRLASFRYFSHPSGRATVWLEPEPGEAVRGLQAVVQQVFPQCDDLSRFPQGYTPHLSIGQAAASGIATFVARLQSHWQPIEFAVEHITLIARRGEEPFAVRHRVDLGPRKPSPQWPVSA